MDSYGSYRVYNNDVDVWKIIVLLGSQKDSNRREMISAIIPVYNIEKKTRKFRAAVASVVNQSYHDIELIIVNDGSTDKTGELLDSLRQSDKRIKIVTKENGGVESSRRIGLKYANGDYIIHMDQDDMYRHDAFEMFVHKIEETGADVIVANHVRFFLLPYFTFGKCNAKSMQIEKVISHDVFMDKYFVSFFGINDLPVNIWNKMYRKEFLNRIPTPPKTGHIIEDLSYNMHVLPYASKIAIVPDVLYYYRWGGFTNRYDNTILDTALIGYKLKMAQIDRYRVYAYKTYVAVELINYLNTYFYQIVEHEICNKDDFEAEVRRVLSFIEVQEALNIVKAYKKYHRKYVDAMLKGDSEGLYIYEMMTRRKNWKKRFLKKILLKV